MAAQDDAGGCRERRWDAWGRTFYEFWFDGADVWDHALDPAAKTRLVETTVPQTTHEIAGILDALETQAGDAAVASVDALAALPVPKDVVLAATAGKGSAALVAAMAQLLEAHAGFNVHRTPGGHMAPVTHPDTTMPLLAKLLVR